MSGKYRGLTAEEHERRAYANGDVERAALLRQDFLVDSERDVVYNSGYDAGRDAGYEEGYEDGQRE